MIHLWRHYRTFVGTVLGVLTLAVGANVTVFAVVSAIWLRPLPFPQADRLVVLMRERTSPGTEESMSAVNLEADEEWPGFQAVAGQVVTTGELASLAPRLVIDRVGRSVESLAVTSQYFSLLGLAVRGRDFTREDNRYAAEPVAIISDRLWRRSFDADPNVIGALASARPFPVRIIGVAPAGFSGARRGEQSDLWLPSNLAARVASGAGASPLVPEDRLPSIVFARLHPGQTAAQARDALVRGSIERQRRDMLDVQVVPLASVFGTPHSPTVVVREFGAARVAAGLSLLVLVAGCLTLTTLILVHYERRRPEFAVQLALGATPRQLLAARARELAGLGGLGSVTAFPSPLRASGACRRFVYLVASTSVDWT